MRDKFSLQIESGLNIPKVKLLPQLTEVEDLISRTCEFFFKRGLDFSNSPFKGFLLEGPPGIGKTEVVKQVARKLDRRLGGNVFWLFIDGASIAAPRWGDAEKALKQVFLTSEKLSQEHRNPKLIIHFDDIESLMLARGVDLAKEWHYSINAILFHEIDQINPTNTILCATTNRIDLVDEALRDRLYVINMPSIPIDQLKEVILDILSSSGVEGSEKARILEIILLKIKKIDNPTIRDARHITVVECIEKRVWES